MLKKLLPVDNYHQLIRVISFLMENCNGVDNMWIIIAPGSAFHLMTKGCQ
jgi:hypothetical protein